MSRYLYLASAIEIIVPETQFEQLRRIQFLLVVLITLVAIELAGPVLGLATTAFVVLLLAVDPVFTT